MANLPDQHPEWEDEWREAFDGAEIPPSPHVWKSIESELVVQETGKYRKGFFLYRAIAASLLLLIAGLSWHIFTQHRTNSEPVSDRSTVLPPSSELRSPKAAVSSQDDSSEASPAPLASSTPRYSAEDTSAEASFPTGEKAALSVGDREEPPVLASDKSSPLPSGTERSVASHSTSPTATIGQQSESTGLAASVSNREATAQAGTSLTNQVAENNTSRAVPLTRVDGQDVKLPALVNPLLLTNATQLYRVPQPPTTRRESKDRRGPSFFAGLVIAPGYFDPQLQASAPSMATPFTQAGPSGAPGQEGYRAFDNTNTFSAASSGVDDSPELSFTYGVDVGMKLFDHWVIESGIDYNRFSTQAETSYAVADVATGNRYPYLVATSYQLEQSNATRARIATTDINNAYEFISVPVQVGYQVAVSKLNFILSSGVAANFFLGNDISTPSSPLTDVRVTAEEGAPFKSSYYSGVLSGGVNYNVLSNYFLSLTPSYSFALTELTRDESTLTSQPYSFGINVGFRYQF